MAVLCFPGSQWQGSSSSMRCSCHHCNTLVTAGKWCTGLHGRSQSAADRSDQTYETAGGMSTLHLSHCKPSCSNNIHAGCLHWQLNPVTSRQGVGACCCCCCQALGAMHSTPQPLSLAFLFWFNICNIPVLPAGFCRPCKLAGDHQ